MSIDPRDSASSAAAAIARAAGVVHLDPDGPVRPGDFAAYGWHTDGRGRRRPGHCGLVVSVPGWTGPTPAAVLRALQDLGRGRYKLGGGGLADDGVADCSGWLLEVLGVRRVQRCAGWSSINTSAMLADAAGNQQIFRFVPTPQPVPWAELGLVDCSASHPGQGAIGRRTGELWGRMGGRLLRLV